MINLEQKCKYYQLQEMKLCLASTGRVGMEKRDHLQMKLKDPARVRSLLRNWSWR